MKIYGDLSNPSPAPKVEMAVRWRRRGNESDKLLLTHTDLKITTRCFNSVRAVVRTHAARRK